MASSRKQQGDNGATTSQPVAERFRRENFKELADRLRSFAAKLAGSEIVVHAQDLLPEVLRQAELLSLKRGAIADACDMSEATISRWSSGEVQPHIVVARAAIEAIRNMALRQAKLCDQYARARSPVSENA
jgi:hypothetical protein